MKLEKRTDNLRTIRKQQRIPGVIYGREIESTPVETAFKDFVRTYQSYGMSMTFNATLGDEEHQVYLKEVQTDPIRQNEILHFDLQKVSATDTISAEIPIEIENKEHAERRGLVVEVISGTVEMEFPAGSGISNFTIDVSQIEDNDTFTVADLDKPEGFKPLVPEDKVLVSLTWAQEEEIEEVEPEAEEDIEVEAIKQKDEDEEAEEADESEEASEDTDDEE